MITIAIVEDLDEVREGLKNFLSLDPEFRVIGVYRDAVEAVDGIIQTQPDIAIMDINLPGKSGIDCIIEIRKHMAETQFMMFTVYENDEKVFQALNAGASGYILKSTGLPHIIEALKELYGGGSPMSANIARKLVNAFQQRAPASSAGAIDVLTGREMEILQLLAQGLLYKEIADRLSISTHTVRQHIHRIYEKLHVQNRTEAINKLYPKGKGL
jgi:DNA-binding NarL/FixJ family response regulator